MLSNPRWLAATAGGLAAAVLSLWAMRGLPLGFAAFWLTPLPLFAAGLGFGPGAMAGAARGAIDLALGRFRLARFPIPAQLAGSGG